MKGSPLSSPPYDTGKETFPKSNESYKESPTTIASGILTVIGSPEQPSIEITSSSMQIGGALDWVGSSLGWVENYGLNTLNLKLNLNPNPNH